MIDRLLYYPQFCMAAVGATFILMIMYFMKRNFNTRSNRIFFVMLIDNLLASLINISTFYVITFPEKYPLWVCNMCNVVYLFLYNLMAVLFLIYVDSKTKVPGVKYFIWTVAILIGLYDFVILFSSPYTHLAIYYDENMVYTHGPLMTTLYITAFVSVAVAVVMFIMVRKKFNAYQVFSITGFAIGVFASVIFQLWNPKYVISNFVCAMVLFFIYIAFENQAYYLHGDTPCYNRRAFIKSIHRNMKHKRDYVTMAIHIKDFENLMRNLGRAGADALSERIAERMSRYFGKEAYCIDVNSFAVVHEGIDSIERIISLIKKCFDAPFPIEIENDAQMIKVIPVITAMHIHEGEIEGYEMAELFRKLEDMTLQEYVEYTDISELLNPIRRENELIGIIDRTLESNSFEVYYQPILDVESGGHICAEALVRMKDEDGKYISPEEFIPVAEKSGRIYEIGKIVFREVCRFIRDENIKELGAEYIEVNLSPEQCQNEDLGDWILSVMKEYGVEPNQINLEITETSDMRIYGMERLRELMTKLHKEGVTFSLDDFGSGFAAISYLINLPVDIVKIDKGILWQAMRDDDSMVVLKSTIRMIQAIRRKIVVEGIETEEMERILKENRCDYLQGYLYSKPIPGSEYVEFLKEMQKRGQL